MFVAGLWLADFRCYREAELRLPAGVTVISGANAQGKTSLLEAIGWAATGRSFRGVPDAALVRSGSDLAVLRAEVVDGARVQLLEAELHARVRNRVLLNRQPVQRARDQLQLMRVTVFSPDDLELVKGGPAGRREYLDDLLGAISPRYEAVFDAQLAGAGAELARGRLRLLERLVPAVAHAYAQLSGSTAAVTADYEADWIGAPLDPGAPLAEALLDTLEARRAAELDRRVTLAGPHRDEWRWRIADLDSRTHASQGEQRTLALALRLGSHRVCADLTGTAPVLLLDDVFSELDEHRSAALIAHLDAAQTVLTCVNQAVPVGIAADHEMRVAAGRVEAAA
jgi:DNA replication and repair protein RecF